MGASHSQSSGPNFRAEISFLSFQKNKGGSGVLCVLFSILEKTVPAKLRAAQSHNISKDLIDSVSKGDLPELQSDWWIPCMQRSRRMIPQQTMKVGKRLSSESLPLWFAWDLRLPRICKSEEYIQDYSHILYIVSIALGCF